MSEPYRYMKPSRWVDVPNPEPTPPDEPPAALPPLPDDAYPAASVPLDVEPDTDERQPDPNGDEPDGDPR